MSGPIDDLRRLELDALLDGALPAAEAAELRARIEGDAELRAEYERRRRTVELVRGLPSESVPEGFSESLLQRVPPAQAGPASGGNARGRILRSPWLWGAGLAAAAAMILAVSLGDGDPSTEDDWTLAKQDPEESVAGEIGADKSGRRGEATPGSFAPDDSGESVKTLGKTSKEVLRVQEKTETAIRESQHGAAAELDTEEAAQPVSALGISGGRAPDGAALDEGESRGSETESKSGRDRTARGGGAVSLMQLVEERTTSLTSSERARYLDRVVRISDDELRAHMERLSRERRAPGSSVGAPQGPQAPRERAKAKGAAEEETDAEDVAVSPRPHDTVVLDVAVAKRSDAEALRKLLARAFPPERELSKKAAGPEAKVSRNEVAADSAGASGGELRLDWTVSARDAAAMAVWLKRIGLRNAQEPGSGSPTAILRDEERRTKAAPAKSAVAKSTDSGERLGSAAARSVPVRIRIRFGAQEQTPERPKGDDK